MARYRKMRSKNRFAGSDAIYFTKKHIVREDVYTDKEGKLNIKKRYIKKTPQAYREYREIWG